MTKVFYAGSAEQEQAIGAIPRSEYIEVYAIKQSDPTVLYSLGGHRFDDAATYNKSEAKRVNQYVKRGGRNIVAEKVVGGEYTKSVDFTLQLPMRVRSVTDILYNEQERNGEIFDFAFVPNECLEGCDRFFYVGRDGYIGSKDTTSSIVGYDDNGNPISYQRQITTTGELITYEGLEQKSLTTQTGAVDILAIDVYSVPCATGENCQNQTIVRAGEEFAEYSEDGGATWTTIDVTAITADIGVPAAQITSVLRVGNNFVFGYSDVADGTGLDGGVAYSTNGSAAVLAQAGLGTQVVVEAFNKVYAFGTGGEMFVSCDNGVTWSAVVNSIVGNVYSAAYDATTKLLFIGAAAGEAWVFDGELFTEITTEVDAGAADLTATAVLSPNKVAFGGSTGTIYENYNANNLTATYEKTVVSAGAIYTILGDGYAAFRTLVGSGTSVYMRDLYTDQKFEVLGTVTGSVLSGDSGESLINYAGGFYVFGSSDGTMYKFENCQTCLSDGNC